MSGPQLQTQRNKRRRKFTKFLDLYYTYFPPFFFLLHPSPGFVSFLLHPLDIIPTEHEEKKRRLLMLYIAGALSLACAHIHPTQRLLAYCIVCVNMCCTAAPTIIITRTYPECGAIFPPRETENKNRSRPNGVRIDGTLLARPRKRWQTIRLHTLVTWKESS